MGIEDDRNQGGQVDATRRAIIKAIEGGVDPKVAVGIAEWGRLRPGEKPGSFDIAIRLPHLRTEINYAGRESPEASTVYVFTRGDEDRRQYLPESGTIVDSPWIGNRVLAVHLSDKQGVQLKFKDGGLYLSNSSGTAVKITGDGTVLVDGAMILV